MKTSRLTALAAVLSLMLVPAAFAKTTTHHKAHGMLVRGSISALDSSAKTFSVKRSNGKTTDLVWNDATKTGKTAPAVGENVSVRYMVKDGKNVATVITEVKAATKSASAAKTTTTAKTTTATAKPAAAKAATPAKSTTTKTTTKSSKSGK